MKNYLNSSNKKTKILKYLKFCLKKGNKEKTEKILKNAFALVKKSEKINPLLIFLASFYKARPFCEIKNLNIRGNLKKLPVTVSNIRQQNLALRWLSVNALERNEKTFSEKLSKELIDTVLLQSKTVKICDELHKTVEANKTFIIVRN
jgi:small subunit ribosomal protein S7